MRIRKNASKVLGSASVYAATAWPPSPAMTATAVAGEAEGLIACELNCSPWDVMLMDNNPNSCSFLANPKGEDESEGILGKTEKEEEPIYAITSTAGELTLKEIKEIEEKKVKRKKSKDNKEKASAEMVLITHCKKSDGKGWHCKRPAQLPHSCSYHLAQTRAYSSSHRASADHASEAAMAAEMRAEGGDSNNNLYYYYYDDDGFGPWRRGRALISAEVREEEKEDGRVSMDRDDDDNVVADGDAYDLDCLDEDDDDNDCNSMSHQHKIVRRMGRRMK